MPSPELERLAESGLLKRETPGRAEIEGLIESAASRLGDARKEGLSLDSRFDLAYNAGHALALAALRWHGYRSEKRYLVFQCLPHTLGASTPTWRLLARCHEERNRLEYEGMPDIDELLVKNLIESVTELLTRVRKLGLPPELEG